MNSVYKKFLILKTIIISLVKPTTHTYSEDLSYTCNKEIDTSLQNNKIDTKIENEAYSSKSFYQIKRNKFFKTDTDSIRVQEFSENDSVNFSAAYTIYKTYEVPIAIRTTCAYKGSPNNANNVILKLRLILNEKYKNNIDMDPIINEISDILLIDRDIIKVYYVKYNINM